ncbi:hypothetical protein B9479_006317 [Cryptococcus floricola]|uniref:Translation initiation factor eIF2B subunit epsilon n=1 Tax=Cryptococcus floricola TaxID=2591691 RepID=A0A5D3ASM0_9TREE|nr:hypothetical protein B9479_006317 [Cryptococcus floricola]
MPPKKQQQKHEPKSKDQVDEAPLQAVILADSYNRRFEVLATDQPRVLLPLCSTPLLSWTLESLALSKVLNADNPFILVHSPLVSNYDLSKIVDAHKKRREVDKNFIMTMGVGRGGRPHPESPVMLVHPPSSRLLHYSPHPLSPAQGRAEFPAVLFTDPFPVNIDTYEIWSGTAPRSVSDNGGYRDLGVDICEADVPALCTENFDYHDLRRHFVNGVLTSELLGKKIAVHVVGEEEEKMDARAGGGRYVERVRDTRTFGEVTRDVLRRWAFPLAPDLNEPSGVEYELRAGNVYIARESVVLSRTTTLTGPLLIGPKSSLSHNTLVQGSTLGANCKVGDGSAIRNSYIFDDVRIGEGCLIEECMIGKGVVVGAGCKIGRGVLLGNGVKLGKNVSVPDFARIGREPYRGEDYDSDDSDFEEEEAASKARSSELLGNESVGFLWPNEEEEPASDSEDEDEDLYEHPANKKLLQLGRRLSNLSSAATSLSTLSAASSSAPSSPVSMASSTSLPDMPSLQLNAGPPPAFYHEAAASLQRAYEEDHKIENALLELRTLVMGYNAGLDRAREEVVKFFVSKVDISGNAASILGAATKVFTRWGPLISNLTSDPTLMIIDAQSYTAHNPEYVPWFGIILRGFYEADLVTEEELVEWRDMKESKGENVREEEGKAVWKDIWAKGKGYVDVLEAMESEDEDDECEEEEESSDEE